MARNKKSPRRKSKAELASDLLRALHRNTRMTGEDVTDLSLFGRMSFEKMKTAPTPQGMYNMTTVFNLTAIIARDGYAGMDADLKTRIFAELQGMVDRYETTGSVALSGELVRMYPHVLEVSEKQIADAPRKVILAAIEKLRKERK